MIQKVSKKSCGQERLNTNLYVYWCIFGYHGYKNTRIQVADMNNKL